MQTVLIFCEGGTFGLGHVKRQIVLARELQRRGMSVIFTHPARERVGWDVLVQSGFTPVEEEVTPADMLIVDIEEYPGRSRFIEWRSRYPRIVLFGGAAYPRFDGENLVDLTVYEGELFDNPPSGKALNGPQYLIIDPAYARCQPDYNGPVVVSMGGRDPFNMTPIAHAALADLDRMIVIIIGKSFDDYAMPELARESRQFAPESLVPFLDGAALCVCATGMTAYEALCAGVPCVLGDISEDHRQTALGLQERGVALDVGLWTEFTAERCASAARTMLDSRVAWEGASQTARALVDGRGVERVAERICQLMTARS